MPPRRQNPTRNKIFDYEKAPKTAPFFFPLSFAQHIVIIHEMASKLISLSWPQVIARRLARQGLGTPMQDSHPAQVVSAMCGAHAQVLSAAELSIGIRHSQLTRADIQRAHWVDHTLIKTFGPRGTVHLLPATDFGLWLGALSAIPWPEVNLPKDARLTSAQSEKVVAAISDALEDSELTVDELSKEVIARCGTWAGDLTIPAFQTYWPRWRLAIGTAAARGVLCFAPNRGRNVTYTNPRRWFPKLKPTIEKKSLRWIVLEYLHAYGPATPQHFAQWLVNPGLARWAAELFEDLGKDLRKVDVDGLQAWVTADEAGFPNEKPHSLRLLPYFDAYIVASHPRGQIFPRHAAERAMARGQPGNFPILLIDGVVAGVWHQRRSGRNLHITVEALNELSMSRKRDLDVQVARIGEFLDAKPKLTIGKVSAGAHA